MGHKQDEIVNDVNLSEGVTSVDENGEVVVSEVSEINETGDPKASDVLVETPEIVKEKEEVVLTAEEPVAEKVINEKSFTDLKQDAMIKYLHAGMKMLVGKLSNEEQRNFYLNFPELR